MATQDPLASYTPQDSLDSLTTCSPAHQYHTHPMHPTPPPSAPVRQIQGHRGPPLQLSLYMQYGHGHSAGPYSGCTPPSTTSPITADIVEQMN